MRSPKDAVSTCIWSMVWQLVVLPGTHSLTVVNSVFTSFVPAGPASTTTLATLATTGELEEPAGAAVPPLPPPPQESPARHSAAQRPKRHVRAAVRMSA